MKFQVKFYDIIDHNKCPSSKKSAENVFWGNHFFTILNLRILHSTQTMSYLEEGTVEDVNGIRYNIARDRNSCATGQSQDTVIEAKLGV